jgi:hypothetical protein
MLAYGEEHLSSVCQHTYLAPEQLAGRFERFDAITDHRGDGRMSTMPPALLSFKARSLGFEQSIESIGRINIFSA